MPKNTKPKDTHVHISAEAHATLKAMAEKKNVSIKVVVDELLAKKKK